MYFYTVKRRSDCPTNYGLEHFGDKWSLLIIRDLMFKGKRHYNEFLEAEEKVSTSVLRDRLRSLEAGGLIRSGEDLVKKSRIRYSLTAKGIALLPMMVDIIVWSGRFDEGTAADADFLARAVDQRAELIEEIQRELRSAHL